MKHGKSCVWYMFLMAVYMSTHSIASKTISETLHACLLGSGEVSSKRKKMIQDALESIGVEHVKDVPINKMNGVGPFLAGQELYTFTADGIWVNESLIEESGLSVLQERYLYRHEAAHYALNHHKTLLTHLIPLPIMYWALYKTSSYCLKNYSRPWHIVTAAIASLLTTALYNTYHLKPLSQELCQQADL